MNKFSARKVLMMIMLMSLFMLTFGCSRNDNDPTENSNTTGESAPAVNRPEEEQLDNEEEEVGENLYYVLYLKHKDQAYIFSDTYSIKLNDKALENKSLGVYVIEELIQQKGVGELINPIHPDTKVLSLVQDGRKVTVDLSNDFTSGMRGTSEDTEATIAMVVNTLITLPGIDEVTLLIDGKKPGTINGLAIKDTYGFITEYYPDK